MGGSEGQRRERTTGTLIETAACRTVLWRESSRDLAKIICDLDGCANIGKSKVRIDLSRNYEFGTDVEDPILVLG